MSTKRRRNHGLSSRMTRFSGLEIRQLRAFVALADRKRVTAAAAALGLAQSTVSEALAALERALGTSLILRRRGGHGVQLTDAGRALLPHARKILSAVDDAHGAVVATTARAHATVEIVANESVSSYLLPGLLSQLRQRWPRTRFTVSVGTCAGVRQGVEGGAFDVGLLLEESDAAGASGRDMPAAAFTEQRVVVPRVPLVLFAAPSHPLTTRRSPVVRLHTLAGYALFVSDAVGAFHDLVHRFFTSDRLGGPAIEATGSIEGVKKAVSTDAGALGLLPAYAVADELRAATIARVNLHPPPPRMRLDALLSQTRARHPSADELLLAIGSKSAPRMDALLLT